MKMGGLPLRLLYVFADILTAMALYKVAQAKIKFMKEKGIVTETGKEESYFQLEALKNVENLPSICASAYLLMPFSVLTCTALDTSVLVRTAAAYGFVYATKCNVAAATFCLALAGYVEMWPSIYITAAAAIDVCFGHEGFGLSQRKKQLPRPDNLSPLSGAVIRRLGLYALCFVGWFGLFHMLSSLLFMHPKEDMASGLRSSIPGYSSFPLLSGTNLPPILGYIKESYVWQLRVCDHTPNVGLFWYFFSIVFDRFRPYFLFAFNCYIFIFVAPLFLRTWRRPLVLTTVIVALVGFLRPYPTIGDASLPFALALMSPQIVARMRIKIVLMVTVLVCACIMPAMWFLWIFPGAGNANHYYFAGLVYSLACILLATEFLGGAIQRDRQLEENMHKSDSR